ncbi:MAG: hypothetical protein IPI60_05355 [Saprospiraceae bacterium]|nr:hypothetical protein [Saprospiraceae bacterium]
MKKAPKGHSPISEDLNTLLELNGFTDVKQLLELTVAKIMRLEGFKILLLSEIIAISDNLGIELIDQ